MKINFLGIVKGLSMNLNLNLNNFNHISQYIFLLNEILIIRNKPYFNST